MATRAERKALLFIGVVALLGSGVRIWRVSHPAPVYSDRTSDGRTHNSWTLEPHGEGAKRESLKNSRSKRHQLSDSTSILDLDRATVQDIEALGVLGAGGAKIIVANRDSFGPFGSLDEVKRIPYLTPAEIRKLARRVTFSAVPRPKNAVMSGRGDLMSP